MLPLPDGSYALTYRVAVSDGFIYFVDAGDGRVLHRVHARMSQSAIGAGTNFQGQRRKLNTTYAHDRFEALDAMRPAEIVTLDLRFNNRREERLVEEHVINDLPPGERVWTSDDIAADADNDWDDPAVVDAHAYSGWFYDYLSARHGWAGVDGAERTDPAHGQRPRCDCLLRSPTVWPGRHRCVQLRPLGRRDERAGVGHGRHRRARADARGDALLGKQPHR